MSNVNYLINNKFNKNNREVWTPELESLDILPEELCELPLLGYVTAGEPVLLSEENETVAVPGSMVRTNSYALRVRGHSMIDDNIEDGDIVRFTVEDNKIVIAPGVIVDKDQAYFFSERCQKEIRESEKEFKEGKYSSFTSVKDLKKAVDSD